MLLRTALESVLAVDYPGFEVIVVDNASKTADTRNYVVGLSHPRLQLIHEPQPGASRARNAGLMAASGDVVAFVDDDVVVDRHWLRALMNGFTRGPSVSCVSGIVPAAEIRTPAQAYFDARVGWSDATNARVYDLATPPRDVPLFPFAVRCYGTGASFAVERDVAVRIGGFDEHLGPGTPTGGGEDLDLFFRILRSGRQLVHEPSAVAWHRHRADNEALLAQTRGYGLGLGAWLSKIAGDPETAWLAVKTVALRSPSFIRHLRNASREAAPSTTLAELLPPGIGEETTKFFIQGARAYRSARRAARRDENRTTQTPHAMGADPRTWDGLS
jgi:glycosyltransferase involved in cell wall biosynthesis